MLARLRSQPKFRRRAEPLLAWVFKIQRILEFAVGLIPDLSLRTGGLRMLKPKIAFKA